MIAIYQQSFRFFQVFMGRLGPVLLRTNTYFSKFLFDKVLLNCSFSCNNHSLLRCEKIYFLKTKVTWKSSTHDKGGCNIMLRYGYVIKMQETKFC